MNKSICTFIFVATIGLAAGCDSATTPTPEAASSTGDAAAAKMGIPDALLGDLTQVRAATARYQDLEQARADGYVDIDVFVPNMGYHYLQPGILDATFDPTSPELMVYATRGGRLRLVAVEYAVPVDLSPEPPEGFAGEYDKWVLNEAFGLWTLHAWIWLANPDGVFAAMNPVVP